MKYQTRNGFKPLGNKLLAFTHLLQTEQTEAQIREALGIRHTTFITYTTRLATKFGVKAIYSLRRAAVCEKLAEYFRTFPDHAPKGSGFAIAADFVPGQIVIVRLPDGGNVQTAVTQTFGGSEFPASAAHLD